MEDEDFLAAVEADNVGAPVEDPKPEPEPAPVEETPQEPEQPAPEEPAPAPEPIAADPAPKQPEPGFVPITAILDEREKRQAAEAELARLREAAQQQVKTPDPYEEPEEFARFQEVRVQQAILNQTLNTSERFARKEHGAETVEAAKTWAQQRFAADPLYQQQVLGDPDPYERVVTDYRREQLFSKVSDPSEFDAFLQWKAAQNQLQQQAAPAAPPNPAPAIPPRSLASAPSAGGVLTDVTQSDAEIFEETFKRK